MVSKSKQTGGPENEPVAGHVQQRCNKRLKNVVLQAVEKVRQFGPQDLREATQKLEARGAHTEFAMAKRLVRLAKYLVITGTIYRPKALLDAQAPKEKLVLYYQGAWDRWSIGIGTGPAWLVRLISVNRSAVGSRFSCATGSKNVSENCSSRRQEALI